MGSQGSRFQREASGCWRRAGGAGGPRRGGYCQHTLQRRPFCEKQQRLLPPAVPLCKATEQTSQAGPWLPWLRSSKGLSGRLGCPELPGLRPLQGCGLRSRDYHAWTPLDSSALAAPTQARPCALSSSFLPPFLLVVLAPRHLWASPCPAPWPSWAIPQGQGPLWENSGAAHWTSGDVVPAWRPPATRAAGLKRLGSVGPLGTQGARGKSRERLGSRHRRPRVAEILGRPEACRGTRAGQKADPGAGTNTSLLQRRGGRRLHTDSHLGLDPDGI